jgi:hypothetical protein
MHRTHRAAIHLILTGYEPPHLTFDVTSSSNTSTVTVPRLRDDGANWVDYEVRTRNALGGKGLIRHVEGTVRRPLPFAQENGVPVTRPGFPATYDEIEEKEKKLEEYMNIILQSMPQSYRLYLSLITQAVVSTGTTIHPIT